MDSNSKNFERAFNLKELSEANKISIKNTSRYFNKYGWIFIIVILFIVLINLIITLYLIKKVFDIRREQENDPQFVFQSFNTLP